MNSTKSVLINLYPIFSKIFTVFWIGKHMCYRANGGIYFVLDSLPDNHSIIIHYAVNLSCVEKDVFTNSATIDITNLSSEQIVQAICSEILSHMDDISPNPSNFRYASQTPAS